MLTVFLIPKRLWAENLDSIAKRAERTLEAAERAVFCDHDDTKRFTSLLREIEMIVRNLTLVNKLDHFTISDDLISAGGFSRLPWDTAHRKAIENNCENYRHGNLSKFITFVVPRLASEDFNLVEKAPSAPASIWRAPKDSNNLEAQNIRWNQQLSAAMHNYNEPIIPSGVGNRTITEGLRKFINSESPNIQPTDVRVVYRDGSEARPFRLHHIHLVNELPKGWPELRLALLSLRHPEMDAFVDASLLRNRDVSIVRPTAETDNFVYLTSLVELKSIVAHGERIIRVYQTGFEPAIIGFYRAFTDWMADAQDYKKLIVVPMYYRKKDDSYVEGLPWGRS